MTASHTSNRRSRSPLPWLTIIGVAGALTIASAVGDQAAALRDAMSTATSDVGPNGSHDGRYHTCGYITEDGVTENLEAYWERCGKVLP